MTSWKNWIGAGATVVLLTVSSCASWTPAQKEYTAGGAAAGALIGGGLGCGIAAGVSGSAKSYEIWMPDRRRDWCSDRSRQWLPAGAEAGPAVCAAPATTPPPPPPPPPPPVRQKLVLRGVHFDFNKARIRPGDAAILDEAASTLKANPNVTVNVNGYCDAIGSEEYNLKLSDRRADAVVNYLVKDGIPSSQLIPHGYGKTDFVAPNNTAEGRAQNRRVELVPND